MRNFLKTLWQNPIAWFVFLGTALFPAMVLRFMQLYSRNRPVYDDMVHSAPIAIATRNGTLSFMDMIRVGDGIHPIFFSNIVTVLSTWLTRWDVRFDAFMVFGGYCAIIGLTLWLLKTHNTRAVLIAAIPVSALVMNLQKDFGFVIGVIFQWGYVDILLLLALLMLNRQKRSNGAFLLAALFAFATSFASSNGILTGLVLFPAVILLGYRRWYYIAGWLMMCAASIGSYFIRPGLDIATNSGGADFSVGVLVSNIPGYLNYALIVIGRAFAHDNLKLAVWAGVIGLVLLILNAAFLLSKGDRRPVIIWASWALMALASSGLISLGRYTRFGLLNATVPWYMDIAMPFWLGLLALMALTLTKLADKPAALNRVLAYTNITLLIVGVPFYGYAVSRAVDFRDGGIEGLRIQEDCFFNFPVTRDDSCLIGVVKNAAYTDQLAVYGLGMFAQRTYTSILPETAMPDSLVIIETGSLWYNDSLQRLFLSDVQNVAHMIAPDVNVPLDYKRTPRLNTLESLASVTDAEQFWFVRQTDLPTPQVPDDFVPMYRNTFTFTTLNFDIIGYQHVSKDREADFIFGDSLNLLAWEIPGALDVVAGETVMLETVWTAREPITPDYHLTFVLSVDGVGAARNDRPLGFPTSQWQTDNVYADVRGLTVPDDLASGTYPLLIGVYDLETLDALPITTMDGGGIGDLLYLTDVVVR